MRILRVVYLLCAFYEQLFVRVTTLAWYHSHVSEINLPWNCMIIFMIICVAVRKCADFKRATWQLTSGHYISLDPRKTKFGSSLKHCKEHCLKETSFSCKSFDRKVGDNNCYLHSKAKRDLRSNEFKASEDSNHYEWICKGIPSTWILHWYISLFQL